MRKKLSKVTETILFGVKIILNLVIDQEKEIFLNIIIQLKLC